MRNMAIWAVLIMVVMLICGVNQAYAGKGKKAGKGDNRDDTRSGKVDRRGDGNSGQGDDLRKGRKGRKSSRNRGQLKKRLLKKYDRDGDGKLNKEERARFKADYKAHRAKGSKKFDGNLSEEERAQREIIKASMEEARAQSKADLLDRFDQNGNGKLEGNELKKLKEIQLSIRWQKLLDKHDQDGDGKLSEEEAAPLKARRGKSKAKRLEMFDKNGNGKLEGNELKAFKEAQRKRQWQNLLKKYDKDGDGKISEGECVLLRMEREDRWAKILDGYDGGCQLSEEQLAAAKKWFQERRKRKGKGEWRKKHSNRGVRDHGKGEGRNKRGQGKGKGRGPR